MAREEETRGRSKEGPKGGGHGEGQGSGGFGPKCGS